jgi:hypothetical protein
MLPIALKEWSIVCDLLVQGRTALVLRKGGVHEFDGPGRFRLEHERFAMFPAWEHERLDWIKPTYRIRDEPIVEPPSQIDIWGWAEVAGAWPVTEREAFDRLDDLHVWEPPQINMRFNYKPDRPVWVLALRVHRLHSPKTIPNRNAFAGCRSWVPLAGDDEIDPAASTLAMPEEIFSQTIDTIHERLAIHP